MNPALERLKLIFIALFVVVNVALLIWHFGWQLPRDNCEQAHKCWDGSQRVCAQPVLVSDLTGRVIADPKARAEALKAIGRPAAPASGK